MDESTTPGATEPRKSITTKGRLGGLLFLGGITAVLALTLVTNREGPIADTLGNDLCPAPEEITGSTVFLADLRKPLSSLPGRLPTNLLRGATRDLAMNAELRVFAVGARSDAPRVDIGRICKPYPNADLQVAQAKDAGDEPRDCDDVPAQVPRRVREAAQLYCARRDELASQLEALAASIDHGPVSNAFLVEAVEASALDLAERPPPRALLLFSDLLQHAKWYSHPDRGWRAWQFDDYAELRAGEGRTLGPPPTFEDIAVTLHVVPRRGVTDLPQPKRALRQFWRTFFAPANPALDDQPPMPAYVATPLTGRAGDEERDREALDEEWARLELERARLTQEAERLEQLAAELAAREAALNDTDAGEREPG